MHKGDPHYLPGTEQALKIREREAVKISKRKREREKEGQKESMAPDCFGPRRMDMVGVLSD
jgi:hypothetical protein